MRQNYTNETYDICISLKNLYATKLCMREIKAQDLYENAIYTKMRYIRKCEKCNANEICGNIDCFSELVLKTRTL